MSTGVLFGLSHAQIETFAEALQRANADFDAAGTDAFKMASLGRNLAGLIQYCQEIPRVLQLHCHSVMDMIPAHAIDNYAETGNELQRSFQRGREVLEGVLKLTQRFQTGGRILKNAESVQAILSETQALETAFFAHWPHFEAEDAAAALQAFKRGECVDVDDAFAQIKGVNRDVWLQRVAQRKTQTQK